MHFMVRSFHSFSVKLTVKHAFLAYGLKFLHMSGTLVFAHGLKTLTDSDYIVEQYKQMEQSDRGTK